ncbi:MULTISPECIES: YciI family protein [unclassified Prochlorococcus]|uniref:YciI family protein n=1 Tax=unclassified Prochlorococcus TaxID=2627481 RepID=UPI0005338623|nr:MULTISPECIES: YciI family protein [unclassified Prochlorococcus]KGG14722.1 putative YCII family conserved protein [Prochlorococcus sp. MIT 0602]KGG15849.1 putative YCII family conserved protein [Prochlorococcus sp. MIT 0603]
MPLFIKTEKFKKETLDLIPEKRSQFIQAHMRWAAKLKDTGKKVASGYLINDLGHPGGGGFLILEANDFNEAKLIVMNDPMIKNHLVEWEIHQWVPVIGELLNKINEDNPS